MRLLKSLFLLTAVLGLALAGCDGEDTTASNGSGGTGGGDRDAKPVIGVSIPAADHGWTGGVVYWANQAREMYGDEAEIRSLEVQYRAINQKHEKLTCVATVLQS